MNMILIFKEEVNVSSCFQWSDWVAIDKNLRIAQNKCFTVNEELNDAPTRHDINPAIADNTFTTIRTWIYEKVCYEPG